MEKINCPICGGKVDDAYHHKLGNTETDEGCFEYWECFLAGDVFSIRKKARIN